MPDQNFTIAAPLAAILEYVTEALPTEQYAENSIIGFTASGLPIYTLPNKVVSDYLDKYTSGEFTPSDEKTTAENAMAQLVAQAILSSLKEQLPDYTEYDSATMAYYTAQGFMESKGQYSDKDASQMQLIFQRAIEKIRGEEEGEELKGSYSFKCPGCDTVNIISEISKNTVCLKCGIPIQGTEVYKGAHFVSLEEHLGKWLRVDEDENDEDEDDEDSESFEGVCPDCGTVNVSSISDLGSKYIFCSNCGRPIQDDLLWQYLDRGTETEEDEEEWNEDVDDDVDIVDVIEGTVVVSFFGIQHTKKYYPADNLDKFLSSPYMKFGEQIQLITFKSEEEAETKGYAPGQWVECPGCGQVYAPEKRTFCKDCGASFYAKNVYKQANAASSTKQNADTPRTAPQKEKVTRKLTPPAEYDERERHQPEQGKSRLGRNIETGKVVDVPQVSRRQGLSIIGIQGTGKSVLIENLIIQDIKQNNIGVCVLDPHGDLIDAVLSRLPERREKDVIYLDITDYHYPFGINLFTCTDPTNPLEVQKIVDQVKHIFEKLLGVTQETQLILEYLYNCTCTLIANPGYTMADIPLLLQDEESRTKLVANVTDIDVQRFWRCHDRNKQADQDRDVASTLRRVRQLLQPLSRNIVGQSTSTIDIRQVMHEGKILLIKLDRAVETLTELIGSLFIALILNAAQSRADLPANKRRQFNLYADEFQRFSTEDFATLLEEARKYAVATTIAHQNKGQLDSKNSQLETNLKDRTRSAANLVVFRINSKDAGDLAGEFDITPQEAWEEEIEPEWEEEIEKEWLEVLKEEWTERVEEEMIDGEEPLQVFKREIVDHLLKQGHEDERVMQFVRTYLQPLSVAADKNPRWHGSSSQMFEARQTLVDLNSWLYEGMVNQNNLFQPLPESIIGVVLFLTDFKQPSLDFGYLYRNRNFYQIFYEFWCIRHVSEGFWTGGSSKPVRPAIEKMLAEYTSVIEKLRVKVQTSLPQTAGEFHALRSSLFLQTPFHRLYQDAVEKRAMYEAKRVVQEELDKREHDFKELKVWEREGKERGWRETGRTIQGEPGTLEYGITMSEVEPDLPPGEYERWIEREKQQKQEEIDQGFSLFDRFTESLQLCQFALSQRPLMTTQSGLYQPRKRTQIHYITHPRQTITHPRIAIMHPRKTILHPQRTYADMLNEVASQLTNLPVFTARVKITSDNGIEEHTIRTLDPKKEPEKQLFGQALQERKDRIKEWNIQDGYLRERAIVEEEIRIRQEPPDEPEVSRKPR